MNSSVKPNFKLIKNINENYFKIRDSSSSFIVKDLYKLSDKQNINNRLVNFKLLSKIKHSNLLKINYYDDYDYLVEEGCNSKDLIERLSKLIQDEHFYEEKIIFWIYQLISAVGCLHQNGILHKRISKGWVFFVGDEIKLCINKECNFLGDSDYVKVSRDDVNYNAPELTNSNNLTLKYDIWCLGWLLFNMCTLDNPFQMLNLVADFKKWQKPIISSHFSVDLIRILNKMTDLNPLNRPSTKELLNESLFTKYNYHFDKTVFNNNRFIRLNDYDKCGISFQAEDAHDHDYLRIVRRYFANETKINKLANLKIEHLNLNWFVSIFREDMFIISVEPVLEMSLVEKLEILNKKEDTTSMILNLFIQILKAVDYLHNKHIIHKFICPNFIGFKNDVLKLNCYEKSEVVEVFGDFVQVADNEYAYNSPEILNNGKINLKYDIWCLGYTFYYMLTLNDPYEELKAVKNFDSYFVESLNNNQEFNLIIDKMVDKVVMNRASVSDILSLPYFIRKADIEDAMDTNPIYVEGPIKVGIQKENNFIERYEKINILSQDSFGITYLVNDLNDNLKNKVLKMFKNTRILQNQMIKKELDVLDQFYKACPHENLIKFYNYTIEKNLLMVTEHFTTDSLNKLLEGNRNRNQIIKFQKAIKWLYQLASAINYLHNSTFKIAHKDIRPENIYINDDYLKLGTIGLSRLINDCIEYPNSTEINVFSYMSPEILRKKTYDIQTDIWSFGCIMFEIFTLQKAFTAYTVEELIKSIVNSYKTLKLADMEMNKLLSVCLDKTPSRRINAYDLKKNFGSVYDSIARN